MLGLDVGRARIGMARAETGMPLAFGRGALQRHGTAADVSAVRRLAEAEGASVVVVGLPRRTRGGDSAQTSMVRAFGAALQRAGLRVVFEDERFTTALSERRLRDASLPRGRRRSKAAVDEASAILILESYLARLQADPDGDAPPGDLESAGDSRRRSDTDPREPGEEDS